MMDDKDLKEIFDNFEELFSSLDINQKALITLLKEDKVNNFCVCRMCKCFQSGHSYSSGADKFGSGVWGICIRHAPSQGIAFKENEKWLAGRILPQVNSMEACYEGIIDLKKEIKYRRFDNILNYKWVKEEKKEYNIEEYKFDRQKYEKQNIMLAIFRQEGNILNRKFNNVLSKGGE